MNSLTQDTLDAAPEQEINPIFPLTLDLRTVAPGRKTTTEKRGLVR